jgi:ABC-2 type transport system ATP-binding protein
MTPTIEARGLEKRYRKTRALDRLDLVAEPGQVTAVLGPTGPAKRPSCEGWRPYCASTQARCGLPATTSVARHRRCAGISAWRASSRRSSRR